MSSTVASTLPPLPATKQTQSSVNNSSNSSAGSATTTGGSKTNPNPHRRHQSTATIRLDQSDNHNLVLQQFPVPMELSSRHFHHHLGNGQSPVGGSSGTGPVSPATTTTTTGATTIHQLKYVWIFWHYRRSKRTTKTWMDCQRILAELDTLEGFWRFFVQLRNPSMVKINQDYALFKRGIKPMWEDPVNVKGGQWIFVIQKSHENYRLLVDHVWNEIVLALVGSTFNSSIMNLVCGVVFSMRISCFTKISVWISDYTSVKEILVLGHELKRLTNFEDCIIFRRNDDMKVKFIL